MDRNSYDTAASHEAQGNLASVVAQLESLIGDRDRQVQAAMADFRADGVDDQYRDTERRWNSAAGEVRSIIAVLKTTMQRNDESAATALGRARGAVSAI